MRNIVYNLFKQLAVKVGLPLRWKYLTKRLSPYLKNSGRVLDVGASCGTLACELSKDIPEAKFEGVDVYLQPESFIPVTKYDGKNIPHPGDSFDCVMLIDVLHHDNNPEEVLREAKRVSRKYILIKDHYWDNEVDFTLLKVVDYAGNKPCGVRLPYNFMKINEWNGMFNRTDLKTRKIEKFRYNAVDPCKHVIYLLEK